MGAPDGCWPRGRQEGQGGVGAGAGEAPPAAHQRLTRKTCSISCRISSPGTRCGPRPADALLLSYSWRTSSSACPVSARCTPGGGGRGCARPLARQLSRRDRNHRTLSLRTRLLKPQLSTQPVTKPSPLGAGLQHVDLGTRSSPRRREHDAWRGRSSGRGRGQEADSPSSLRGSTALQSP